MDVASSITTLRNGTANASAELGLALQLDPAIVTQSNDRFPEVFKPFIPIAEKQTELLVKLLADLRAEVDSVKAYFAENPDGSIEELFNTVLSFAIGLQKAAAEMTKFMAVEETSATKSKPAARPLGDLFGPQKPGILPLPSASASAGRPVASGLTRIPGQKVAAESGQRQSVSGLAPPATDDIIRSVRGTMTRGDLDEAIRTIHGGVRRRERQEASTGGGSGGGGVRLSKMFLDGANGIGTGSASVRLRTRRQGAGTGVVGGHGRLPSSFR